MEAGATGGEGTGGGAPAAGAAGVRENAPETNSNDAAFENAHDASAPSSEGQPADDAQGDAAPPSAERPLAHSSSSLSASAATRFRSGWGSAPKVPKFHNFAGEGTAVGETAARRRLREARAAVRREKEEEERRLAEAKAEEQRMERERIEERERLDKEIEEKRRELERMKDEEARRNAAAAGAVAPVATASADVEEGGLAAVENAGEGTPQPEAAAPEDGEEKGTDEPPPDPKKRRRWLLVLVPLLLLLAIAIPLGVVFGTKSENAAAAEGVAGAVGVGNETDAPSLSPSQSPSAGGRGNQLVRPPRPTPPVIPRPTLEPTSAMPTSAMPSFAPTSSSTTASTGSSTGGRPTLRPVTDGQSKKPTLQPVTTPPTRRPTAEPVTGRPTVGSASVLTSNPTTLSIEAADSSLTDGSGGAPNTLYSFTLTASNIPAGINQVRFEWTPGFGAGGSEATPITVPGTATTTIELSYPTPGAYTIAASVYDGQRELAAGSLQISIAGTTLTIDPPGLTNAQLLVPYSFNLVAGGIPGSVTTVKFTWSFGVGPSGVGESGSIPATGGSATAAANQIYTADGAYGLVVDVRDASTDAVLAESSATVIVGQGKEREDALLTCGGWAAAQSGGGGVTVDNWDISAIPDGAVFDLKYDAYSVPDKFVVEYPFGNVVLDTGWRGSSSNEGSALYPGGISGVGSEEAYNILTKLTQTTLRVTAIGPDPSTGWEYDIRCRQPILTDGEVCTVGDECPSAVCAYESLSPASSMVCCSAGQTRIYVTSSDGWITASTSGNRYFCTDQPLGTTCGATDAICESQACVGQTCRSSKLAANEVCSVGNDCETGTCGYGSFSPASSTVCCASGASFRVYTTSSDGWPSSTSRYFCTDQPVGTACGETDAICASDACVGGTCQSAKLLANAACTASNDCELGSCAYESFSPTSSNVCCASGASTRIYLSTSDGWPSGGSYYFCTDQPLGTACGETDAICASDACVGGTCQSAKLLANAACTASNDCELGSCAYGSFSPTSSTVCCASGASTRIYLSTSDGWPSGGSYYFCTDQPLGTACGETDSICASDACVGGTCQSAKLAANSACSISNDCALDACGYGSFSPTSPTVCCASGATTRIYLSTSDGWPSSASRYFCTDQPDGTQCGETDAICASDACVGQTCQSAKLLANAACTASNDCELGSCAYGSFSPTSSTVCCASGASTRIYTTTSDGWPSSTSRYFCTGQPDGTLCGSSDPICSSNNCDDGGTCASANLF